MLRCFNMFLYVLYGIHICFLEHQLFAFSIVRAPTVLPGLSLCHAALIALLALQSGRLPASLLRQGAGAQQRKHHFFDIVVIDIDIDIDIVVAIVVIVITVSPRHHHLRRIGDIL